MAPSRWPESDFIRPRPATCMFQRGNGSGLIQKPETDRSTSQVRCPAPEDRTINSSFALTTDPSCPASPAVCPLVPRDSRRESRPSPVASCSQSASCHFEHDQCNHWPSITVTSPSKSGGRANCVQSRPSGQPVQVTPSRPPSPLMEIPQRALPSNPN